MAFALSKFRAYALGIPSATDKYGLQAIEMTISRTSSDVLLDLDDVAGTFWTAALADGTYGAYVSRLLPSWTQLLTKIENIVECRMIGDGNAMVQLMGAQASSGTVTAKWAGGSAGTALNADSADQTFTYSITNGMVTLSVPGFNAAAKGAAPGNVIILKSTTLLPAALRPAADMKLAIAVTNNAALVLGYAVVKTTGQIEIYKGIPESAYTVTAAAGPDSFQISYPVAQVEANTGALTVVGNYPVVKPRITLQANAVPANVKLYMILSLNSQAKPVEFL
jgi:hypothetical protein